MSMRANYFNLGLFVIVSTAILVAGVIVLGAGKLFEKRIYVETYMDQSVQGLDIGADVKFRGVTLGTVSNILLAYKKYDPRFFETGHINTPVLVEIALNEEHFANIPRDRVAEWFGKTVKRGLRARMASSGLTGPPYIELVFLDPVEFPPPAIDWTPPDLYIPSAPSELRELINSVHAILTNLEGIDAQIVAENLDRLLVDVDTKVNQFDVQKISGQAVALLQEVRASNRSVQDILANPNIEPSLENLRATLDNAREATAQLPAAVTDVRRAVRRIDRLVASQQATIEAALEELRRALENISTVTEDAKDNPSRVLFGDPPPRKTPGGNP